MTGGRYVRSSSASSKTGSASTSSAAWTISTCLLNSSARMPDGVVGQRLRERRHLAEHHELLDDLRDRHAHRLGDVLDRRAGVDPDEVGVRRGGLVERGDGVVVRAAAAAAAALAARRLGLLAGRAARGLRVDDDAAPAAGTGGAGRALAGERGARRAVLGGLAAVGGSRPGGGGGARRVGRLRRWLGAAGGAGTRGGRIGRRRLGAGGARPWRRAAGARAGRRRRGRRRRAARAARGARSGAAGRARRAWPRPARRRRWSAAGVLRGRPSPGPRRPPTRAP